MCNRHWNNNGTLHLENNQTMKSENTDLNENQLNYEDQCIDIVLYRLTKRIGIRFTI